MMIALNPELCAPLLSIREGTPSGDPQPPGICTLRFDAMAQICDGAGNLRGAALFDSQENILYSGCGRVLPAWVAERMSCRQQDYTARFDRRLCDH